MASSGAKLEHHRSELFREPRMRGGDFHADPSESRLETKPRFDAHEHEIERIGEAIDELALSPFRTASAKGWLFTRSRNISYVSPSWRSSDGWIS